MGKRFYGRATAEYDAEDSVIVVEVNDGGGYYNSEKAGEAWCSLTIEDAARLAEQIDTAIDLSATTARAREAVRQARIAGLKAALAELENSTPVDAGRGEGG